MVVFSNLPHRCSEFPLVVLWHAAEVYEIVDLRLPACQRKKYQQCLYCRIVGTIYSFIFLLQLDTSYIEITLTCGTNSKFS